MNGYSKPRLWDALIIFVVFALIAVYAVVSINTSDPLWAWPRFSGTPERIIIYQQGQTREITPGSEDYDEINGLINDAIGQIETFHDTLGASQDTLQDYYTKQSVVVVIYAEPVTIHTRFNIGRPNNLLIPLTGRHSQYNPVFCGLNGGYWPGVLGLKTLDPLKDALRALGYIE